MHAFTIPMNIVQTRCKVWTYATCHRLWLCRTSLVSKLCFVLGPASVWRLDLYNATGGCWVAIVEWFFYFARKTMGKHKNMTLYSYNNKFTYIYALCPSLSPSLPRYIYLAVYSYTTSFSRTGPIMDSRYMKFTKQEAGILKGLILFDGEFQ